MCCLQCHSHRCLRGCAARADSPWQECTAAARCTPAGAHAPPTHTHLEGGGKGQLPLTKAQEHPACLHLLAQLVVLKQLREPARTGSAPRESHPHTNTCWRHRHTAGHPADNVGQQQRKYSQCTLQPLGRTHAPAISREGQQRSHAAMVTAIAHCIQLRVQTALHYTLLVSGCSVSAALARLDHAAPCCHSLLLLDAVHQRLPVLPAGALFKRGGLQQAPAEQCTVSI
jgi:hypothetical protein